MNPTPSIAPPFLATLELHASLSMFRQDTPIDTGHPAGAPCPSRLPTTALSPTGPSRSR
ncbi:protein of unknown function [Azospirillum baldaniorum]|uniref:Uncharacterized protein n=1 Tax=Azospirillum baldaniorum TaxID=1064539 RepID=A0A9P1NML5_9PROT|nr:protein of unknown function [Azospirillum baldaniorum]